MFRAATFISNESSPVKLTLITLAGISATKPSRKDIKGKASLDISILVPSFFNNSRAFGPQIVALFH